MPDVDQPELPTDPDLLRALAENPQSRPSVRVAARRALAEAGLAAPRRGAALADRRRGGES
jgi:hypothetical protein